MYVHVCIVPITWLLSVYVIAFRQKKNDLREMKKKKNEKKLARMQVIDQHREGEKQRWKSFSAKVSCAHWYTAYSKSYYYNF